MSRGSFRITNLEQIKQQIPNAAADQIRSLLEQAVNNAAPLIIDDIIEYMSRTETWRGIEGQFAGDKQRDIQAHMGLSSTDASASLRDIERAVRNSFVVEFGGVRGRGAGGQFAGLGNAVSAQIFISFPSIQDEIEAIPGGSYQSTNGDVPWINWLLNGGGVFGYSIIFDAGNRFNTSRSGRALMRENPGGDWHTADYAYGQNDNFVNETFNDDSLIEAIVAKIRDNFDSLL